MQLRPILLFGYSGHSPERVARTLAKYDAVLVDVRSNPYSKQPGWAGAHLCHNPLIGPTRYHHIRAFGNVNYKDRSACVEIADFDAGWAELIEIIKTRPAILMCGCRDEKTCHRATLRRLIRERHGIECVTLEYATQDNGEKKRVDHSVAGQKAMAAQEAMAL